MTPNFFLKILSSPNCSWSSFLIVFCCILLSYFKLEVNMPIVLQSCSTHLIPHSVFFGTSPTNTIPYIQYIRWKDFPGSFHGALKRTPSTHRKSHPFATLVQPFLGFSTRREEVKKVLYISFMVNMYQVTRMFQNIWKNMRKVKWATFKTQNPDDVPLYWLVHDGILLMAYHNPYISGVVYSRINSK